MHPASTGGNSPPVRTSPAPFQEQREVLRPHQFWQPGGDMLPTRGVSVAGNGTEVQILGPIAVRSGEIPVPLPGGRIRAVLALLAVHHGGLVSCDRLVDAVWSGRPAATARTQVYGFVSALRRILPQPAIQTHGNAYTLCIGPVALDLAAFESATRSARAAVGSGDHAAASAEFRSALSIWRGAAFDGLDCPYLTDHASRLDRQRAAVFEEWAGTELALGRHATISDELMDQLHLEPVRESLCVLAMTALYRAGRQADAFNAFQTTRSALRDALGVDPGPQLRELYRQILTADDALLHPHPVVRRPSTRASVAPHRHTTSLPRFAKPAALTGDVPTP